MVGFSIDYAHMQRSRTELRRATDLAVKAAAFSLSQDSDEGLARQAAIDIAAANSVIGEPLQLAPSEIIFGTSVQEPDGSVGFVEGGTPRNSVRVIGNRTSGSLSGPVNTYFGALYNSPTFEPSFTSAAAFVNADICLVLDRSISMKWKVIGGSSADTKGNRCAPPNPNSRWVALEGAVNSFVELMEESAAIQKVAMVTFASDVTTCGAFSPAVEVDVPLVENLTQIRDAMASRSASEWSGRTDIAAGIQEGQAVLNGPGARSSAFKIMVVMTDGVPTEDDPVPFAEIAALNGIQVYTITFSDGADKEGMQAVATAGNGAHYHAESTADLVSVFGDLAGTLTRVIE